MKLRQLELGVVLGGEECFEVSIVETRVVSGYYILQGGVHIFQL